MSLDPNTPVLTAPCLWIPTHQYSQPHVSGSLHTGTHSPMSLDPYTPVLTVPVSLGPFTPVLTVPVSLDPYTPILTVPVSLDPNTLVLTVPVSLDPYTPVLTVPVSLGPNTPVLTVPVSLDPYTPVLIDFTHWARAGGSGRGCCRCRPWPCCRASTTATLSRLTAMFRTLWFVTDRQTMGRQTGRLWKCKKLFSRVREFIMHNRSSLIRTPFLPDRSAIFQPSKQFWIL